MKGSTRGRFTLIKGTDGLAHGEIIPFSSVWQYALPSTPGWKPKPMPTEADEAARQKAGQRLWRRLLSKPPK